MADIVRKTASLNDPLRVGFVRTYFVDGKEVYRETLDKNLDIVKHEGSLPDGTVKEFFRYILNANLKRASATAAAVFSMKTVK